MNAPFVVAQATSTAVPGTTGQNPSTPLRIVKLAKPQGEQALVIQMDGNTKLDFTGISGEKITLVRAGERLVILFDNKSTVTINPFFDSSGKPLQLGGIELDGNRLMTGEEFASLFPITEDQSVLPAAGEGSPAAPQNTGGPFAGPNIDPLNGLNPLDLLPPEQLGNFVVEPTSNPLLDEPVDLFPSQITSGRLRLTVEEEHQDSFPSEGEEQSSFRLAFKAPGSGIGGNEDPNDETSQGGGANADGQDQDTNGNNDNTTLTVHGTGLNSLTSLITGGNGPLTFSVIDLVNDGNPNNDAVKNESGGDVYSQGEQVFYTVYDASVPGETTIEAWTNPSEGGEPRLIFTLTVETNGDWTFTLFDQIDHPLATLDDGTLSQGDLEEILGIDLTALVQAVDTDGDVATLVPVNGEAVFVLNVVDDTPIVLDDADIRSVNEDDIKTYFDGIPGSSLGTSPNDGPFDGSWTGSPFSPFDKGPATIFGSLTDVVKVGADEVPYSEANPSGITFSFLTGAEQAAALAALNGLGLDSKGEDIVFSFDNGNLVGTADGRLVMQLILDPNGDYTFQLYDQVDHDRPYDNFGDFPQLPGDTLFPPADQNHDLQDGIDGDVVFIDFGSIIKASDYDNDSVVLKDRLLIKITDDIPVVRDCEPICITVDEDDIVTTDDGIFGGSLGNHPEDGPFDGSYTGSPGSENGGPATVFGSLAGVVQSGADEGLTFSFVHNADDKLRDLGLTSQGQSLRYDVDPQQGGGYVLYGFVDKNNNDDNYEESHDDRLVFQFTLNADGSFKFELYDQLDHDAPDYGHSDQNYDLEVPGQDIWFIDFGRLINATDFDGDTVNLDDMLLVKVRDDVPEIKCGEKVFGVVEEEHLHKGNEDFDPNPEDADRDIPFSNQDYNQTTLVAVGNSQNGQSLTSLIKVGADEKGTFDIRSSVDECDPIKDKYGQQVTSDGKNVEITDIDHFSNFVRITAGTTGFGGHDVFELTIWEDGSWKFELKDQLDHHAPEDADNAEGLLYLDFSNFIEFTDFDGDSVCLEDCSFIVKVIDDVPEACLDYKHGGKLIVDETLGGSGNENDEQDASSSDQTRNPHPELTLIGYTEGGEGGLFEDNSSVGADQNGSRLFSLVLQGAESGLKDSETNQDILLKVVDGNIIGYFNDGNADVPVFAIVVDSDDGDVRVFQYRAVEHDNPNDHDESNSPEILDQGLVYLNVEVTDEDGDSDSASLDIGKLIKFEDSGVVARDDRDTVDELETTSGNVITGFDPDPTPPAHQLQADDAGTDVPSTITRLVHGGDTYQLSADGNAVTKNGVAYGNYDSGTGALTVTTDQGTLIIDLKGAGVGDYEYTAAANAVATTQSFHVLDNFFPSSYDGNDGTKNWAGNWSESNEGGTSPSSGDIRIVSDAGSNRLRFTDSNSQFDNDPDSIQREVDLSGATAATLTFDYRRVSLEDSDDVIRVLISNDGGDTFTLLDTIGGGAFNDAGYQGYTKDITAYISNETVIKFEAPSGLEDNDFIYVDDVKIAYDAPVPVIDEFTYTLTDSDGDHDDATLKIEIKDTIQPPGAPEVSVRGNVVHDETAGLQGAPVAPTATEDDNDNDVPGFSNAYGVNTVASLFAGLTDADIGSDPDFTAGERDNSDAGQPAIGYARGHFIFASAPEVLTTRVFSLDIPAGPNVNSGLTTTDGKSIFLFEEGGLVVGRVSNSAVEDAAGDIAFAIAINPENGEVFVAQYLSIHHDQTATGLAHDDAESIANGALQIVITDTNPAGSTATPVDIGSNVVFEDDGPSVAVTAGTPLVNGLFFDGFTPNGNAWGTGSGTVSGTSAGWTITDPTPGGSGAIELQRVGDGYLGMHSSTNGFMVDLNATSRNIAISQAISGLLAGEIYHLSFEAGTPVAGSAVLEVYFGGVLIDTIVPTGPGNLTAYQYDLVGGSGNGLNVLEFREAGNEDNHGTYLANVKVDGIIIIDETEGLDADSDDTANPAVAALFAGVVNPGTDPDMLPNPEYAAGTTAVVTFTPDYGADGAHAGTPPKYTLTVTNAVSGLSTTEGAAITLVVEGNGQYIVGRYETDGNPGITSADKAAFAIHIDPLTGVVSVAQYVSLHHDDPAQHDEPAYLDPNTISAQVTVTDGDLDTALGAADISGIVRFEDDGPILFGIVTNGQPAGPNLIVNGSFEDGHGLTGTNWNIFNGITGWVKGADGIPFEVQTGGAGGKTAHSGNALVELDSDTDSNGGPDLNPTSLTNATIQQTVPTVSGETYQITFWYAPRPNDGNPDSSSFKVLWNGQVVHTVVSDSTDEDWQQITLLVQASGASSVLGFQGAGQANEFGAFIDDVALHHVPGAVLDDEAQTTPVNPGVDAVGIPGGPGDDNGAIAATSGTIQFDAGADGLKSLVVNSVLANGNALQAIYVHPVTGQGTPEGVSVTWTPNPGNLGGIYTGVGAVSGQAVFTLTVDADGDYTFVLQAPLEHSVEDDPNTSEIETEYEDNLSLSFGFTITDGDNDSVTGALNINVDDDTLDVAPEAIVVNSNPAAGPVTGDLNFAPGADGVGGASLLGNTPPDGLTSGGLAVKYWVSADGQTLIGYTGATIANGGSGPAEADKVFVLTVNPGIDTAPLNDGVGGQYTFDLLKPLDNVSSETVTIGGSTAFGSGPTLSHVLTVGSGGTGQEVAVLTGWATPPGFNVAAWQASVAPLALTQAEVNGSTAGWGVAPGNTFNGGDFLRFDFGDNDFTATPFAGPDITKFTFELSNFGGGDHVVKYVVHYTDGTTIDFGDIAFNGGGTTWTFTADPGKLIDYVELYANEASGGPKVDLVSVVAQVGEPGDANLSFNLTLTDGDGDSETVALAVQIDQQNLLVVGSNVDDTGASSDLHEVPSPYQTFSEVEGDSGNDLLVGDVGGGDAVPGKVANFVFVLDDSGSIGSTQLAAMKAAVVDMLNSLGNSGAQDVRVHIVHFADQGAVVGTYDIVSGGLKDTTVLNDAIADVNLLDGDGSTNYEAALQQALQYIQGGTQTISVDTLIDSVDANTTGSQDTARIIGNGTTQIALVSGWDNGNLVNANGSIAGGWGASSGSNADIDTGQSVRFDFGALDTFSVADYDVPGFSGIPVLSATFALEDKTSGEATNYSWTVHFTDGDTESDSESVGSGDTETVVIAGTGGNAGKQIAWIEFTVEDDDSGDVDLQSVTTPVTAGTLPNATVNELVFISDGEPNRAVGNNGSSFDANTTQAIQNILGQNGDAASEVDAIESDGDLGGPDLAFSIQAFGVSADSGGLTVLGQVEGAGGSASNIASATTLSTHYAAVIASLAGSGGFTPAGSDIIQGKQGNDIIFGDVLFTDNVPGSALPDGSGWAVFEALEATPGWDRADTVDYIKANAYALAAESGRDGGDDVITGGAGDDTIFAQEGDDNIFYSVATDGHDIVHGGSEPAGGADVFHLDIAGAGETIYLETAAAYETRTGNNYVVPAGSGFTEGQMILVSNADPVAGAGVGANHQMFVQMTDIEEVVVTGSTADDTFVISGSFTGTGLSPSTIYFNGGDGNDTLDLSDRASGHRVVADGGTHTGGDNVLVDFAYADIDGVTVSGGWVQIAHDGIVDEFSNFENITFDGGLPLTLTFTDLLTAPNAPSVVHVSDNDTPVTGNVASGGVTDDTSPTVRIGIAGTGAAAGDSVQLFNGASALGAAVVLTAGNITNGYVEITPTGLSNGTTYNFNAKVTDLAGNTSAASANHTVTVDTAGPTVQSITMSDTALKINDTATVTITFSEAVQNFSNADVSVPGTGSLGALASSDGGVTWTGTFTPNAGVTDNTNDIDVNAGGYTDLAGNSGGSGDGQDFTIDTQAPTRTAAITSVTDNFPSGNTTIANNGATNDTSPRINGTISGSLGSGEVVAIYRDGVRVGEANVSSLNWTYDDSGVSEGSHSYVARVEDAVGNQGTASSAYAITVDTTAPTAAIDITAIANDSGVTGDFITNDTSLTVSGTNGTLAAGEKVQVSLNGTTWVDVTQGSGTWSYIDPATHNSDFTYQVRVVDAAGNVGNADSQAIVIDTQAPLVSSVAITGASGIQNNRLNAGDTVTVTVTMNQAVTVTGAPQMELNIGGTDVLADYSGGSGTSALTFVYTILAGQNDTNGIGINASSLSLNGGTIRDVAGNNASLIHLTVVSNSNYLVDTIAPTVTSITPTDIEGSNRSANVQFSESVTGFTNADVTVSQGTDSVSGSGASYTISVTGAPSGNTDITYTIAAGSYTDLAGNAGTGATVQDPIILDLDGNGLTFSSVGNGVAFDITNDGVVDQVAWNTSNDGILAMDIDGDGVIDDGSEIFSRHFNDGNFATGGEALASLDDNGDGVIDAQDAAYAKLSVWQDVNANGLTEAGELRSLADHGIASITAPANPASGLIDGQHVIGEGAFTRADGTTGSYVEVALDTWFTDNNKLDLTDLLNQLYDGSQTANDVQLTANGSELVVQVDTDTGAGTSWQSVAVLSGYNTAGSDQVDIVLNNMTNQTQTYSA